jgi:ABC-type lipoprotein export system ATPase subunit
LQHRPDELSGGQQQRLCIARAISIRPALILADEPTGELDSKTGREVLTLLRELAALEQTAIIIATHDPKVQEYVHIQYQINDGQLANMAEAIS